MLAKKIPCPDRIEQKTGDGTSRIEQRSIPEDCPAILAEYAGQFQTIYLDPPFYTGRTMKQRVTPSSAKGKGPLFIPAYQDKWASEENYMDVIRRALETAHGLLREDGTLFVHADSRMTHHIRLEMDWIFGEKNFLNEIIWSYHSGGQSKVHFPRKHDNILFYAKGREYYFDIEQAPIGTRGERKNNMKMCVDEDGRSYRSIRSGGREYRYYDDEPVYPDDVWDDISHLQQKDPERVGLETQKPLKLLDRILRVSSRPGDLVGDLFSGSGTTAVAAQKLGRRFVVSDKSDLSLAMTEARMPDGGYCVMSAVCDEPARVDVSVSAGDRIIVTLNELETENTRNAHLTGREGVAYWKAGRWTGESFTAYGTAMQDADGNVLQETRSMGVTEPGMPAILVVDLWGKRHLCCIPEVKE